MIEITMPRLSDSMQEGTILTWLKADGDRVAAGEELVEIETDKATVTYPSPGDGVLAILVGPGATVAVGEPIARLGAAVAVPAPASGGGQPAGGLARDPPAAHGSGANGGGAVVRATPLARRVAAEHGIDLASVTGTGPSGRVTRADVIGAGARSSSSPQRAPLGAPRALQPPAPPGPPAPPAAPAAPAAPDAGEVRELTRMQRVIAQRMAATTATVPDFQVQAEVAIDALLALRSQLRDVTQRPPSVNDFIVKAAALALRAFPLVNGSYRDGRLQLHSAVNVGVAVALDGGLIVPTVTDADTRSLGSIAAEVRRLADAARDGTITPADLSGATFTVSNLGMYGMTAITPVINAPQAAILGAGASHPVLARAGGEIVDRQVMTLTMSCDHRILYGAEAARFLSRVRELLEQPLALAL